MNKREYLTDLITESLTDWLIQHGERSDHDPYDGRTFGDHHIVVTGYARFIHLLVDGETWYVTLQKPRQKPVDGDWYRREVVGMTADEQF